MLDDQLYLLLDILYQNGNLLKDQAFDNQLLQLRVNIFLLTCEQSEPNPFFQTEQTILIDSLVKLTEDNMKHFDSAVMTRVIQVYKDGLARDCWKKQFGLIHGFPKFCEIVLKRKPEMVNGDLTLFILSVGSNLVLHYDPHFKTIGLKIYRLLLEHGKKSLLEEMNIHHVIYAESFKMLRKSTELDFNDHIYECLLQVVSVEDRDVKTSRWCKFDDVFEEISTQFCTESDFKISVLLLNKIVKFCAITYDRIAIDLSDVTLDQLEHHYSELRSRTTQTNYRTMRWIKRLLQNMVTESTKLLSNSSDCFKLLQAFHSIYILTISNTDPENLGQQLIDFTKKIVLLLMQVARTYKNDKSVIQSIALFLKTIEQHQSENQEFTDCLQKILNHKTFK